MSNKTQLQSNNTNLAALIETLRGKAAGGGGSGGAVETCTVRIVDSGTGKAPPFFEKVYATSYESTNGLVFAEMTSVNDGDEFDVVCGSYIILIGSADTPSIYAVTHGDLVANSKYPLQYVVKVTAAAGGTTTISAFSDSK